MQKSTDSIDLDFVLSCENIFDIFIPDEDSERFDGPRGMEEWLEQHLCDKRPSTEAAEALRLLAELQHRPEFAEGMNRPWRREQISALVRDIFREQASPMELHEMLLLPSLERLGNRRRKFGFLLETDWRKLLPTKASTMLFTVLLSLILLYRMFVR